ncbi:hypothetical protein CYL16_01135 [Mycobacterium sp. EPG1]|nr:hypothetical protein CYL16_01135 [Mycobacterium sp. EPG1]
MLISILVPAVPGRDSRRLLSSLYGQAAGQPVEVLVLCDNLKRSIGRKRNDLLSVAQGDYITFVDDDDIVTDDYVRSLVGSLGADVVTFDVEVTLNGGQAFPMRFSKDFTSENRDGLWLRIPNHLMCVRRELAVQNGFPDVGVGEDADYAKRLLPLLRSETRINRTLYFYRYSDAVTLTQTSRRSTCAHGHQRISP